MILTSNPRLALIESSTRANRMRTTSYGLATAAALWLAGCSQAVPQAEAGSTSPPKPGRAGQPLNPVENAARMAALQVAAATGDQAGAQRQFRAMHADVMSSMKIADPARRIAPEAARSAVRGIEGVRSVVWLDREHLLVRIDRPELRTQRTIDAVCGRLEPLGDTLAVVVHLQNAVGGAPGSQDALSRNCRLAPGDRAFAQRERRVNVLDPTIRAQQRANNQRQGSGRREMAAGDRAALEAISEM